LLFLLFRTAPVSWIFPFAVNYRGFFVQVPREIETMQSSSKLRRAIRSAVLLSAAGGVVASPAMAQLEEVIVTATKRSASTQDIPLAVQALGEHAE
jgi:hypothetical protein